MSKKLKPLISMSLLGAAVGVLVGCTASDHISVSGSTTVLPAVSKAADSFHMETGKVVIVNAGGSGGGFNQLAEGQTHIGMMSRDITPEEIAQFPDIKFTPIAIGRDAVAPVISSEIYDTGVNSLTLTEIAAIYRGDIDNWKEVGGPDKAIFVIDKESSSGTRQTFMKVVMGNSKAPAKGADLVIGSNNEEQTAITQSDSAIGMLSHAWFNDNVKGIAIEMEGGKLITPTLDMISSGSFPITRDLNIIIRDDIAPETQEFVDYLLSERGQSFVSASGYIPVK